jgi:phosphoribosylamine--glycine ligase
MPSAPRACIFGPTRGAAQLEGSKAFTKDFLARHGIPTAGTSASPRSTPRWPIVREKGAPIVVKADGLAAGKGVIVAMTPAEAKPQCATCCPAMPSARPARAW